MRHINLSNFSELEIKKLTELDTRIKGEFSTQFWEAIERKFENRYEKKQAQWKKEWFEITGDKYPYITDKNSDQWRVMSMRHGRFVLVETPVLERDKRDELQAAAEKEPVAADSVAQARPIQKPQGRSLDAWIAEVEKERSKTAPYARTTQKVRSNPDRGGR